MIQNLQEEFKKYFFEQKVRPYDGWITENNAMKRLTEISEEYKKSFNSKLFEVEINDLQSEIERIEHNLKNKEGTTFEEYNNKNSNGIPHAIINAHYLPFLEDLEVNNETKKQNVDKYDVMLANITWNPYGWKSLYVNEKAGHKFVREHPGHESLNFDFDKKGIDTENKIYGFIQFSPFVPTRFAKNGIIVFYTRNLDENIGQIVGIYGKANNIPVRKTHFDGFQNDQYATNIEADKDFSLLFPVYLLADKYKANDKKMMSQSGFKYKKFDFLKQIIEDEIKELSSNDESKNKYAIELEKLNNIYQYYQSQVKPFNQNYQSRVKLLNQILYGPPGTGKTYNAVIKAIEIIDDKLIRYDDKCNVLNYKELKEKFDQYMNNQIKFITFHQSYSYEDFVEGIKPVLNNNDSARLEYEIKDGIFKEICLEAKAEYAKPDNNIKLDFDNLSFFKMSLGNTNKAEDDEIYDFCIENNVIALGYGEDIDFSNLNNEEEIKKICQEKGVKDNKNFIVKFVLAMKKGDVVFISNGNRNIRAIAQITGDYKYELNSDINYKQCREVKWLYKGEDIPVNKIINNNFTQMTLYRIKKNLLNKEYLENLIGKNNNSKMNINNKEIKKYVLIIDEINRGNISKIFGELITLIEPDKRLNNNNSLEVVLPYSQKKFGIPQNLYILGTMNTSDRSIASVDIALRRRFQFIEMMPMADKVHDFGVGFREIFEIMNKKICALLDREHQIGHSYFMTEDDNEKILKHIWYDSILPLLNEYFYGDWDKLQAILGKADEDNKGESFIKKIKIDHLLSDNIVEDDFYYDFVPISDIDFKKAIEKVKNKNA
ncbi:MAG: AAA family ATPase [Endomicrobiaceae bacterium]|nr:AAA family ATPase [Endomicrobiaceae bacterium]